MVVLEVNKFIDYHTDSYEKYRKEAYKEFIIEPIRSTGISPKSKNLSFQIEKVKSSSIKDSFRTAAIYKFDASEMKIRKKTNPEITLTVSTHYKKDSLISYITSNHHFEILYDFENDDSIVLALIRI